MEGRKYAIPVCALLLSMLLVSQWAWAGRKYRSLSGEDGKTVGAAEVGALTWYHGQATGTSNTLLASDPVLVYGISITSTTAVTLPSFITFFDTNTVTGVVITAENRKLWEVWVDTIANQGINFIPVVPFRTTYGLHYRTTDAELGFTLFYNVMGVD